MSFDVELDVAEALRRLSGMRVVLSLSGGKDSAATSLYLKELGVQHERVFLDTGWEAKDTYDYIRGELTRVLGEVTEVRGPLDMEGLIRKKAMFPSRLRRFCTQELKVYPAIEYLTMGDGSHACTVCGARGPGALAGKRCICEDSVFVPVPTVNVVGIRAQESASRAKLPEWEDANEDFPVPVWRPILRWTSEEVIAIHKRHGLAPNPLYLKGVSRVGCWPCTYIKKAELRLLAELDPGRIDRVRALEEGVAPMALERYERDRAEWLANKPPRPDDPDEADFWERKRRRLEGPFQAPTWFQSKTPNEDGRYPFYTIDEAVRWARTSRGGKQYDMFGSDPDEGCMRWGMCERGDSGADVP